MEYKQRQRLLKIIPHCPSLLIAKLIECKFQHDLINIYSVKSDLKWFLGNKFYDLAAEIYNKIYKQRGPNKWGVESALVRWAPVEMCIKLIKTYNFDHKKLYMRGVEENKLELVKAIVALGWQLPKILELDLPSTTRLKNMERGLNMATTDHTSFDDMIEYLVANNLIHQFEHGDSYDPYSTFGYDTSSHYDTGYDNSIFMDHVLEHETEIHDAIDKARRYI
jgi:hypothetical protein